MLADMGVSVLSAVPEPASAVLLVSGWALVAGSAHRRRLVTAATAHGAARA